MSNERVTAYQIAIPLDFKVAINSSIGDMSGDKCGKSSTRIIFDAKKIDSESGSTSWGSAMLVSTPLILTQKG